MGKHERYIVEEAEKIVAILINGGDLSTEQKKHPFLSLIKKFVTLIKNEHQNIKIAKAIVMYLWLLQRRVIKEFQF